MTQVQVPIPMQVRATPSGAPRLVPLGNGLPPERDGGALPSTGSAGHPTSCQPPCKYHWKVKGCKDGTNCNRCHLCPWSRAASRPASAKTVQADIATAKEAKALEDGTSDAEDDRTTVQKEKEERLQANYEFYAHMPEQQLEKLVPKREDGSVTSIGAILHELDSCAPCGFFRTPKGCINGIRCKFCHADHPKKKKVRTSKRKADEASLNAPNDAKRTRRQSPGAQRLDESGNSRPCWLQDDDDVDDIYAPVRGTWFTAPPLSHIPPQHHPWPLGGYPPPLCGSCPTPHQPSAS
eukprot:TRINITY_DN69421_c0_g1_i1.p1 TRINITY_DN69421_c0_g1~~TRINITY_DN69421_c0_g1_i1.p1  ORF type:complete len:294 (+),score=51.21 TRINITY_DN69421_c0_g1_i1:227-1108(+)